MRFIALVVVVFITGCQGLQFPESKPAPTNASPPSQTSGWTEPVLLEQTEPRPVRNGSTGEYETATQYYRYRNDIPDNLIFFTTMPLDSFVEVASSKGKRVFASGRINADKINGVWVPNYREKYTIRTTQDVLDWDKEFDAIREEYLDSCQYDLETHKYHIDTLPVGALQRTQILRCVGGGARKTENAAMTMLMFGGTTVQIRLDWIANSFHSKEIETNVLKRWFSNGFCQTDLPDGNIYACDPTLTAHEPAYRNHCAFVGRATVFPKAFSTDQVIFAKYKRRSLRLPRPPEGKTWSPSISEKIAKYIATQVRIAGNLPVAIDFVIDPAGTAKDMPKDYFHVTEMMKTLQPALRNLGFRDNQISVGYNPGCRNENELKMPREGFEYHIYDRDDPKLGGVG